MQKILDTVEGQAQLHEILENYETFRAIPDPSQFAVIKIGGALLKDGLQRTLIAKDLAALHEAGLYPIVVHGAGPQLDAAFEQSGIDTPKQAGIRVTPKSASWLFQHTTGVQGSELSMAIRSVPHAPHPNFRLPIAAHVLDIWGVLAGWLDDPENIASVNRLSVDTKPLQTAAHNRIIPIVSSIGKLLVDGEPHIPEASLWDPYQPPLKPSGQNIEPIEPININADRAAAEIAIALGVSKYISLTESGAVFDAEDQPISELAPENVESMIAQGEITGGMVPKVVEALKLLKKGIGSVAITSPQNLLVELFTDNGSGTLIK